MGLTYIVVSETFYGHYCDSRETASLDISCDTGDWGITLYSRDLAGPTTELELFHDAYRAFADAPELFAALAAHPPRDLAEARALLDGLGARDVTERPWKEV